jgi:Ca-activated chloride channel family protein
MVSPLSNSIAPPFAKVSKMISRATKPLSRVGAAIILMVVMLVALLTLAGYAINLAHIQLVRTEMQVATDASARAASKIFADTGDMALALNAAQSLANRNLVDAEPLKLSATDFRFGTSIRKSTPDRYHFNTGGTSPNAIHLTVEKSANTPSGPVKLPFPVFGIDSIEKVVAEAIVTQVDVDIALVVDRSGSMAYAANELAAHPPNPTAAPIGWEFGDQVPSPSRWLDTVNAVGDFLKELDRSPQNEHVSLVTYNENATVDQDLTTNYSQIMRHLSSYSRNFDSGGTNISAGMEQASSMLARSSNGRPWASKVIIVMTDGLQTEGSNPVSTARSVAKDGVMIFTITFAAEANQHDMRRVATEGGGRHYHATDGEMLANVFRDIARNLPALISH